MAVLAEVGSSLTASRVVPHSELVAWTLDMDKVSAGMVKACSKSYTTS